MAAGPVYALPQDMADDPEKPDAEIEARFEAALRADRSAGTLRSLAEYVQQFPGIELHVADRLAHVLVDEFTSRATSPPATSAPIRRVPESIGHFRIIRELGHGGQGVVYLAEDQRLRRQVALKVIAITAAGSREAVARFHKEAEAAARIDHPGVCPVYDAGVLEGLAFLAMR